MARQIATQDAVFAIADELADAGQDATLIAIQERVGGSYTTIKRYLEAWRSARQTTAAASLPPALEERGQAFLLAVWQQAQQIASDQFQHARQEAEQAAQAARIELAGAEQVIARLELQNEQLSEQVSELKDQLSNAQIAVQIAEARAGELVRLLEQATLERREAQERAHTAELALTRQNI